MRAANLQTPDARGLWSKGVAALTWPIAPRTVSQAGERVAEQRDDDLCGTQVPAARCTSRVPPVDLSCTWEAILA